MASEQNIERALPLDEVPLKRGQDRLAVVNRQTEVTGGHIIKALLDLKLEPVNHYP